MRYFNSSLRTLATIAAIALVSVSLSACNGDDDEADNTAVPSTVPKATCGPGDKPETALQGEVPASMRTLGAFSGFNCNLQLVSHVSAEGAAWSHADFKDAAGHRCSYYSQATTATNPGAVVVDVTVPSNPSIAKRLTSPGVNAPHESMKVNDRRQLLGAVSVGANPYLDLYDLSADCRNPQLISSTQFATITNGDPLSEGGTVAGHEGYIAPDGLTYYAGDRGGPLTKLVAIDISNTSHPQQIATYNVALPGVVSPASVISHGLGIRDDSRRVYFSLDGDPGTLDLATYTPLNNGMQILDTSDIVDRKPNPQIREVGRILWRDGSHAQMMIPVNIRGKNYVVAVDEGGPYGTNGAPAQLQRACDANLPLFPMARIIDIGDETKPVQVSRLLLEVGDPANCAKVIPDYTGRTSFTGGTHYCSVDNIDNTTTLVCSYFEQGIRVYDIRDPVRPREIAYFNPPSVTTPQGGSASQPTSVGGFPDHCTAQTHLDVALGMLWTTCQDNGFYVLRFTNGVWPFSDTTMGRQN